MSTDKTPSITPDACECRGHGPSARRDGYRYDGAGLDFPCPDCGTTTRQARLRAPTIPVEVSRDIAINQVLARAELVTLARDLTMEGEPLPSLARTVVETAKHLGVDYLDTALLPWTAIRVARREWERLERAKALK